MTFSIEERDTQFVLFEQLKIGELCDLEKYKDFSIDEFKMILEEAGKVAKNMIAPLNEISDRVGAKFEDGKVFMPEGYKEAYDQFAEGGWIGMTHNPEYGGQGLPRTLGVACSEHFISACTSGFNMTAGLTNSLRT